MWMNVALRIVASLVFACALGAASIAEEIKSGEWSGVWEAVHDPATVSMASIFSVAVGRDSSIEGNYEFEGIDVWRSPPGRAKFTIDPTGAVQGAFELKGVAKWDMPPITFDFYGALKESVLTWRWKGIQTGKEFLYTFTFNSDGSLSGRFFIDGQQVTETRMTPHQAKSDQGSQTTSGATDSG